MCLIFSFKKLTKPPSKIQKTERYKIAAMREIITGNNDAPELRPIQYNEIVLETIAAIKEYTIESLTVDVSQILINGINPIKANMPNIGGYDSPINIPEIKDN